MPIYPIIPCLLSLLLSGCLPEEPKESVLLTLEYNEKGRLPVSPHIISARAEPNPEMIQGSQGVPLAFRVLDKRTLQIYRLSARAGDRIEAPWGGWLTPIAFVADLVIQDGVALHGPEGHVNPVVWVLLEDKNGKQLHKGWMFARDGAQTAWDHPRYDMTFLGVGDQLSAQDGY
ncbi:MAG: DUF2155 domain-containing protein [Magnetococcales bacterium]|nr:DUF2155 domain-containing protein [Magnetococcales bacterium]